MNGTATMDNNEYLTFKLDGEVFGLAISKVREVLDFSTVTRVPQTPEYMRGVINLRGSVVSVIDLHRKFDLSPMEKTVNTCVVIAEIDMDGESTVLGVLADSVQEVLEIPPDNIEPAPKIGTRLNTKFIHGMGKHNDEFIILLDIDRVFSCAELASVQNAGIEAAES